MKKFEIYEHRNILFISLCKVLQTFFEMKYKECDSWNVSLKIFWKSRFHSDGVAFADYFIMGINVSPNEQITYHLPLQLWDLCDFAMEVDKAPEWGGHLPKDVIKRLTKLFLSNIDNFDIFINQEDIDLYCTDNKGITPHTFFCEILNCK